MEVFHFKSQIAAEGHNMFGLDQQIFNFFKRQNGDFLGLGIA